MCADVAVMFIADDSSPSDPAVIYLLTGKRLTRFIIGQDDVLIFEGRGQPLVA